MPPARAHGATASPMQRLTERLVSPIDDSATRRPQLVYAPGEYLKLEPFAFSYVRLGLYVLLVIGTCGILGIVSVWFPQLFTRFARTKLPYSRLGEAEYMLVLVHEDGFRSMWVEVRVHHPTPRAAGATKMTTAAAATTPSAPLRPSVVASGKPADRPKHPWVWFEFKKHRYVFSHEKGEFERYLASIHEDLDKVRARLDVGVDAHSAAAMTALYGPNVVDIDRPFIPRLIFFKIVHPFYLFQAFSVIVWLEQKYTLYAIVILVLSITSMTWEIYAEVSNNTRLRNLVKSDHHVQIVRAGAVSEAKVIRLHETELVPGDIIELGPGPVVADVLLLTGGCVVDEASLTGEAVPINKEPVRGGGMLTEAQARVEHRSSFLHAGSTITRIRDASGPCKGVVLSTGFSTGKGELFRSIIFPRAIKFEFERDSYRYLAVLATIAMAAFIKRLVDSQNEGFGLWTAIVNSLDLITIAVPPALPLVLSSGIGFAMERLNRHGIFCIDTQRINSCGQLTCFCFDKTGTLTEESLHLIGADVVVTDATTGTRTLESIGLAFPEQLRLAMGTCHGISEVDGNLQGYSLELSMFEAADIRLEFVQDRAKSASYVAIATQTLPDGTQRQYGVIKRFAFDPSYQRSSVVVEDLVTQTRYIFVKGSSEAIRAIAVDSPADFEYKALRYAAEGNYCIGFGVREVPKGQPLNLNSREFVESSVHFMGIALFHNDLKPESRGMLAELYNADIDVRMITGDNALTAVHVGRLLDMPLRRKVAIVDVVDGESKRETVYHCVEAIRMAESIQWEPFNAGNMSQVMDEYEIALTGKALAELREELSDESLKRLLVETQIFARIRPQQKAWIVERLMDYGLVVGMCGDGTNDCGALKAAHVGLALSSAGASIVAPFTSQSKAVTDVPTLIREGRCALTTSFLGFKYMVLYPIIQLAMASTLGQTHMMISDNQNVWDDLAIVLFLAITMLYTGASKTLSRERPPHTLFSATISLSIAGQVALYVGFFAGVYFLLHEEPWFCHRSDGIRIVQHALNSSTSAPITDPVVLANCAFYPDFIEYIDEAVDDIPFAHEVAVVWLWAHLAYYSVAFAFNLRDPFRLPSHTNRLYWACFLVGLAVNLWFLLDPANVIGKTFQILPVPSSFRLKLLAMFLGHFVATQLWEMLIRWVLPTWRLKNEANASSLQATRGSVPPASFVSPWLTESVSHVDVALDNTKESIEAETHEATMAVV